MKENPIRSLIERGASRRQLLRALAAVGLAPVAVPVLSHPVLAGSGTDPSKLTVFTWAGYDVKQLVGSYIAKYGVQPSFSLFASQEEALTKVMEGFEADTVHPCVTKVQKFFDAGIINPIDTSRLSHWADVWPQFKDLVGVKLADGKTYMIPFDWGNTSYCYNTAKVPEHQESWTELWNPALKGRLSMQDGIDNIAAAALSLNMDPYTMGKAGLDKVRQHLIDQKPLVRFYWETTTDFVNAMANGEIDVALCWNDGAVALKKAGIPVKFANPKEGILAWVCGIVHVNKGLSDDQLVYDYIDAMLDPQSGKYLIETDGFGHSNQKSFDMVSAARLEELGLSNPTDMMKKAVFQRPSPTRGLWDKTWEDIKLGT